MSFIQNERRAVLGSIKDLRAELDSLERMVEGGLDGRTDYASTLARQELLKPVIKDFCTQFGETFALIGDTMGDGREPEHGARQIAEMAYEAIEVAFEDHWTHVANTVEWESSPEGRAELDADRLREDRDERRMLEAAE